jgi:ATP-dependent DNA ligase
MLRLRTRRSVGFIQPCLPSPAERPPSGDGWIHEIKHDGFRIRSSSSRLAAQFKMCARFQHEMATNENPNNEQINGANKYQTNNKQQTNKKKQQQTKIAPWRRRECNRA